MTPVTMNTTTHSPAAHFGQAAQRMVFSPAFGSNHQFSISFAGQEKARHDQALRFGSGSVLFSIG